MTAAGRVTDGAVEMCDILGNERRVRLLRYLVEEGAPADLSDAADALADAEIEDGESWVAVRKRVYVGLYQSHVPKMERKGILEVERGTILKYGHKFDDAARVLFALHGEVCDGAEASPSIVRRLSGVLGR